MGTIDRTLSFYGPHGERIDVHADGGFAKITRFGPDGVPSNEEGETLQMVLDFCNDVLKAYDENAFACCGDVDNCERECEKPSAVD